MFVLLNKSKIQFLKKSFWFIIVLIVILYQLQFYIFPVSIRYDNYGVKVNEVLYFEESKAIKKY